MPTPTNITDQLIRDEGVRLKPYRDSVGKLTIGIGRNLDDVGISIGEAHELLTNDLRAAERDIALALPWTATLDRVRYAVLLNMVFNLGIYGVLKFHATLGFIQAGNYGAAADAMLKSDWATQVGDRATRLADQMAKGEWR